MEFHGPSHWNFPASGAPTGASLVKPRHLPLLGHALLVCPTAVGEVPGVGGSKLYLKRKLPAEGEEESERDRGRGKEREGYLASTSTSVFDGEERTR